MKLKKTLALFLSLVLILSMTPASVLAEGDPVARWEGNGYASLEAAVAAAQEAIQSEEQYGDHERTVFLYQDVELNSKLTITTELRIKGEMEDRHPVISPADGFSGDVLIEAGPGHYLQLQDVDINGEKSDHSKLTTAVSSLNNGLYLVWSNIGGFSGSMVVFEDDGSLVDWWSVLYVENTAIGAEDQKNATAITFNKHTNGNLSFQCMNETRWDGEAQQDRDCVQIAQVAELDQLSASYVIGGTFGTDLSSKLPTSAYEVQEEGGLYRVMEREGVVARIENSGVAYLDLQEAIDASEGKEYAGGEYWETVRVEKSVSLTKPIELKSYTNINLDGRTVSAAAGFTGEALFIAPQGARMNVDNGYFAGSATVAGVALNGTASVGLNNLELRNCAVAVKANGTGWFNFSNLNVTETCAAALDLADSSGSLNNCRLNAPSALTNNDPDENMRVSLNTCTLQAVSADGTTGAIDLGFNRCTVTGAITTAGSRVNVWCAEGSYQNDPSGYTDLERYAVTQADGKYMVTVIPAAAEARIGDRYYDDLGTAFNEAEDGETVELLQDLTLDHTVWLVNGHAFTFDGCGRSITVEQNRFDDQGSEGALFGIENGTQVEVRSLNVSGNGLSHFFRVESRTEWNNRAQRDDVFKSALHLHDCFLTDFDVIVYLNGGDAKLDGVIALFVNHVLRLRNDIWNGEAETAVNFLIDGGFYLNMADILWMNTNDEAVFGLISGGTFLCGFGCDAEGKTDGFYSATPFVSYDCVINTHQEEAQEPGAGNYDGTNYVNGGDYVLYYDVELNPEAPFLQLTPEKVDALISQDFDVTLSVKNNPGVAGMALQVFFDPGAVQVKKVDFDQALPTAQNENPTVNYNNEEGWITFGWANAENVTAKTFDFATITFTPVDGIDERETWLDLRILEDDGGNLIDENKQPVHFAFCGASVNLQYMPGDVNGDYEVNTTDVVALLRWLVGYPASLPKDRPDYTEDAFITAGDVDDNGRITIADVVILLRYVMGMTGEELA